MTAPSQGTLDPQGPVAQSMADLWWFMLVLGAVIFVFFLVLLLVGLFRRATDDVPEDDTRHGRLVGRWLGGFGVAMPAVVIAVVFGVTLVAMRDVPNEAPDGALRIEVTGHQFWYEIRYPDEGIVTANELRVPVGRPLELRLRSDDVIHSFWVPELGGKLDMLPDHVNTLVLEASSPGEFRGRCAEFCGLQHTRMGLLVLAQPAEDFAAWVAERGSFRPPEGAEAEAGRQVFAQAGCVECHAFRGDDSTEASGPDLTDLPWRRKLAAGTLPNTREDLINWITAPDEFKTGVDMPATILTREEMDALLAYLGVDR